MNINELKRNIEEQTRNGRTNIYISADILRELGINTLCKGNVYICLTELKGLIKQYEEKENGDER